MITQTVIFKQEQAPMPVKALLAKASVLALSDVRRILQSHLHLMWLHNADPSSPTIKIH